jgi:hypothetical protein
MESLILNFEKNVDVSFANTFGENFEMNLENVGFEVKLPSSTDWDYVFRIRFEKKEFDIIVRENKHAEKSLIIKIESTLNKLEKLIGRKDDEEKIALKKVISEMTKTTGNNGLAQ